MSSGRQVEARVWRQPYQPLGLRTLLVQLTALVIAEIALYRVYGQFDSRFHWAAHFLVGVIAAAIWLSTYLVLASAPARGQLLVVLWFHLYAMTPDLLFRIGVPHATWMNIFLGHIAVHYIPGGDRTWLVLALLAAAGYAALLSLWLRARGIEAGQGLPPGIGIGGVAVLRPQLDPGATSLAHIHVTGSARPVLLLHGLGASSTFWQPLMDELARKGRPAIAPDLMGYGDSIGIGTRFTVRDQAEAVVRLLEDHDLTDVDVVAHSYGTAVAVDTAVLLGARARHLVLISPPAFTDAASAKDRLGGRSWLARRTLAGAPAASVACGAMCAIRTPLSVLAPHVRPDVPERVARAGVQHVYPAFRDGLDTLLRANPLPGWLRQPLAPTTVILADQDETVLRSDVEAVGLAATVGVVHLPGTHMLPLTDPARTVVAVLSVIDECPRHDT